MSRSKTYPWIEERSLRAFNPKPDQALAPILCALIVDPLEAKDVAKEYGLSFPHRLRDFQELNALKGVEAALQTAYAWASRNRYAAFAKDPWMGFLGIAQLDYRLLCWCLLSIARQPVLQTLDADDFDRETILDAVEAWCRSGKSTDQIKQELREGRAMLRDRRERRDSGWRGTDEYDPRMLVAEYILEAVCDVAVLSSDSRVDSAADEEREYAMLGSIVLDECANFVAFPRYKRSVSSIPENDAQRIRIKLVRTVVDSILTLPR